MTIDAASIRPAMSLSDIPESDLELSYHSRAVVADVLRAGSGLTLTLAPLVFLAPSWPVAAGLIALAGLFGVFLYQTLWRRSSRVRLGRERIALVDSDVHELAWHDLDGLRLRWFGPRRPGAGWLDLELRGGHERIAITSALEGFELVLERSLAAATRNGIVLEPFTQANVDAVRGRSATTDHPVAARRP
jgi:hypothetical protein